jgi:hypothetical protein
MPLELGFGEIGHEVVLELAGGFKVAGAAMRALLGADVVLDEDGAGRGLGSEGSGVLTMLLAPAVGVRPLRRVPAMGGALTAPADVLQLVLDLGQPAAQVGVLRLQVGDLSLEGGEMGQDGGLGLRRDPVPERCGDRRSSSHTLYYETSVQKVRTCNGSDGPKTPSSTRRTAYQLRRRRGLSGGKTVSLDKVTLTSHRLGLTGRPDRLIKADGTILVEEWKSAS